MGARLFITPTQFWAMAKVADRHDMLGVAAREAGHVLTLVDTPAADATWRSSLTGPAGAWAERARPGMNRLCGFPPFGAS